MSAPVSELVVDARNTACPMPILKLARALQSVQPGALVELLATDPAMEPDVRSFCEATGHQLESFERDGTTLRAWVRKV